MNIKFTISQKLLIAPIISIILFSFYIFYTYNQQLISKKYIDSIKEAHYPIIKLANENVILLNNITKTFEDSVGAQEKEWLKNAHKYKQNIHKNIKKLRTLNKKDPTLNKIDLLEENLEKYYSISFNLSVLMIENSDNYEKVQKLTSKMIESLNLVKNNFKEFQEIHYNKFINKIDLTTKHIENIFIFGVIIGLISLCLIVIVTMKVSFSTKESLQELIDSITKLADGNPDFSKRVIQNTNDELGQLVIQFNRFTNKLQEDYNELSTVNKKLEYLANKDFLTGTNNRGSFFRLSEAAFNKNLQNDIYVAMLDIDKFKNLNDTYGHKLGDEALIKFTKTIEKELDISDIFGRLGGEEFALVLFNQEREYILKKIERIRKSIEDIKIDFENKTISFTVSIGLVKRTLKENVDSVLERADKELYKAKECGRNNIKFRI